MRVIDLWSEKKKPTVSFELYPARDPAAAEKLDKVIDRLAKLEPDFVSVTFGAGGSTREGSYALVKKLKQEKGLEVVAYFTCWGLGPEQISAVLDDYRELGVETILAARGDPPHDQPGFQPHPESLAHASNLIAFIKPRYDFCIACAGYPEGHVEAASPEKDLEYLKLKVDRGADFVITNYTYDNDLFFAFQKRARTLGIEMPILPGVMPIYSVKMMENLARLCGASIPDRVRKDLESLDPADKKAVAAYGIDLACDLCRGLLRGGAPGIHIYTMDRSKAAVQIVTTLRDEGLL